MSKLDTAVRMVSGNAGEENLDAKSLNDLLLKLRAIPLFDEKDFESEIDPANLCDIPCAIMETLLTYLPMGGNEELEKDFNPLSVIGAMNVSLDAKKMDYMALVEAI